MVSVTKHNEIVKAGAQHIRNLEYTIDDRIDLCRLCMQEYNIFVSEYLKNGLNVITGNCVYTFCSYSVFANGGFAE